jgi:hypothetical protein
VRQQIASELRQERFADLRAPALDCLAELLQVAVLALEQGCGFHETDAGSPERMSRELNASVVPRPMRPKLRRTAHVEEEIRIPLA